MMRNKFVLLIIFFINNSCNLYYENRKIPELIMGLNLVKTLGSETISLEFSPTPGFYDTPQTITITSKTAGVTIYYTTDGTQPNTNSKIYTKGLHIWPLAGKTIKAYATKSGANDR